MLKNEQMMKHFPSVSSVSIDHIWLRISSNLLSLFSSWLTFVVNFSKARKSKDLHLILALRMKGSWHTEQPLCCRHCVRKAVLTEVLQGRNRDLHFTDWKTELQNSWELYRHIVIFELLTSHYQALILILTLHYASSTLCILGVIGWLWLI